MAEDAEGVLRFVSGAVLFPQRWSLLEKLGMDMQVPLECSGCRALKSLSSAAAPALQLAGEAGDGRAGAVGSCTVWGAGSRVSKSLSCLHKSRALPAGSVRCRAPKA